MKHIPMDTISLSFTVEDWINSDTAEVTMTINASTEGQEGLDLRTEIKAALESLIDTEWRFIDINRSTGRSGLEEWNVMAQARVEEKDLNNLPSRAKELGRKGLQYRVGNVDFTPTKEQFENLYRELRSKINGLISAELKTLGSELPTRKWRVGAVNYDFGRDSRVGIAGAHIMMASTMNAVSNTDLEDVGSAGDFGGFEVSQKIELSANVTVSSVVDL